MAAVVIELAAPHSIEIPPHSPINYLDAVRVRSFQRELGVVQPVQRDARDRMMRCVFHDVMEEEANQPRKTNMRTAVDLGLHEFPLFLLVVPRYQRVRVLLVNQKIEQPVPDVERY